MSAGRYTLGAFALLFSPDFRIVEKFEARRSRLCKFSSYLSNREMTIVESAVIDISAVSTRQRKFTVATSLINVERMRLIMCILVELYVNPLNVELNPICYLLALLGAHHFLHVSRIRVKSLTIRLLNVKYIRSTYS